MHGTVLQARLASGHASSNTSPVRAVATRVFPPFCKHMGLSWQTDVCVPHVLFLVLPHMCRIAFVCVCAHARVCVCVLCMYCNAANQNTPLDRRRWLVHHLRCRPAERQHARRLAVHDQWPSRSDHRVRTRMLPHPFLTEYFLSFLKEERKKEISFW